MKLNYPARFSQNEQNVADMVKACSVLLKHLFFTQYAKEMKDEIHQINATDDKGQGSDL